MPILTLTTDIGQRDYIVGAIKGQFVKLMPSLNTVDITHYLSQTNLPVAAYTCYNAFKYYPEKTYHLVLINVFESSLDYFLIAQINEQYIICADNGLITMMLGKRPDEVVRIPVSRNSTLLTMTQDIAASVFKLEEYGKLSAIGAPAPQIVEKYPLRPTAGPDWIEGQILFIDNFENVVINITQQDFEEHRKGRSFRIMFQRNESIEKISHNYAAVPEHEKIACFNSAGYLEISLRNGNMAGLFGLQGYNEQMQQSGVAAGNKWFYQTIRIFLNSHQ